MPVWFAYRSFDLGPTGLHLRRFDEDDTVLAWFQRRWDHLAVDDEDLAYDRLKDAVGCEGWFLWNPFSYAALEGIPRPESDDDLVALVGADVPEDSVLEPDCLQIFTEDDGDGGAIFYFDGRFLDRARGLAAFFLLDGWRLPPTSGESSDLPLQQTLFGEASYLPREETLPVPTPGTGEGVTFLVILERTSKYPLDDLDPACRIDGVRLPDLARHLCLNPTKDDEVEGWYGHAIRLPSLLLAAAEPNDATEAAFVATLRDDPRDTLTWSAWADRREEAGGEPPGVSLLRDAFAWMARMPGALQDRLPIDDDPAEGCRKLLAFAEANRDKLRSTIHSLIQVESHVAQVCLDGSHTDSPYFGRWILFDDLWAGAHPDLAEAILRFAARWDVLTEG